MLVVVLHKKLGMFVYWILILIWGFTNRQSVIAALAHMVSSSGGCLQGLIFNHIAMKLCRIALGSGNSWNSTGCINDDIVRHMISWWVRQCATWCQGLAGRGGIGCSSVICKIKRKFVTLLGVERHKMTPVVHTLQGTVYLQWPFWAYSKYKS